MAVDGFSLAARVILAIKQRVITLLSLAIMLLFFHPRRIQPRHVCSLRSPALPPEIVRGVSPVE